MSRPKKRKGGRVTPKGTGSTGPRGIDTDPSLSSPLGGTFGSPLPAPAIGPLDGPWDEPGDGLAGDLLDVLALVGDAVASGHPAELMMLASIVAQAIEDAARPDPDDDGSDDLGADDEFGDDRDDQLDAGEPDDEAFGWATVVDELVGRVRPETTALLYAIRPLAPEEWRRTVTAELARRSTPSIPAWIESIADAEVTGMRVRSPEPDGDDVFIGVRWATGQEMTLIVQVDGHGSGRMVNDVIVARTGVEIVLDTFDLGVDGPDAVTEVDPADARPGLEDAVELWEVTSSPSLTDDWPSTRPMLLWALSRLPEGGGPG